MQIVRLRLLAGCRFRNILIREAGTLFSTVSSKETTEYLIHLINAGKSSKWRALGHGPSNLIVDIDQLKWVIAKSLTVFHAKENQRDELS